MDLKTVVGHYMISTVLLPQDNLFASLDRLANVVEKFTGTGFDDSPTPSSFPYETMVFDMVGDEPDMSKSFYSKRYLTATEATLNHNSLVAHLQAGHSIAEF